MKSQSPACAIPTEVDVHYQQTKRFIAPQPLDLLHLIASMFLP
jgi:hypothetical protein